jgi:hypothetical protein
MCIVWVVKINYLQLNPNVPSSYYVSGTVLHAEVVERTMRHWSLEMKRNLEQLAFWLPEFFTIKDSFSHFLSLMHSIEIFDLLNQIP